MENFDIVNREDRVGIYLKDQLKTFVFAEFSDEYLSRNKAGEIIKGTPIPLRSEDLQVFAGGEGVSPNVIVQNMAYVMGCDPHFEYNEKYKAYLMKLFNYKIYEGMLKKGRDAAEKGDYVYACIQFRATLVMKNDYLHGMYSYARVCRNLYLEGSDPEYIGRFKAEALDYFEMLTVVHPKFNMAYYYLGYAYLNLGLYGKADLAWRGFIKRTKLVGKDTKEIRGRLKQIKEPVEIEEACNLVMKGSFNQGQEILEKYLDSKFSDWWPLHYYLGICYEEEGKIKKAIASFENVLSKNPAHIETILELKRIYTATGDKEKAEKYTKKLEIVKDNIKEETGESVSNTKRAEKKAMERTQKKISEAKRNTEADMKANQEKKPRFKKLGK